MLTWRGTEEESVVFAAAGIIAKHERCTAEVAMSKLSQRADATRRTIPDAARLVVAGFLTFDVTT